MNKVTIMDITKNYGNLYYPFPPNSPFNNTFVDLLAGKQIFPEQSDIFKAFHLTPMHKVKVVILGQDPYATPGLANGLAFSVNKGQKIPPSLRNIFKEIQIEHNYFGFTGLSKSTHSHGDLTQWAKQGVLLLNSILTVEAHKPLSHKGIGWEEYTDSILRTIATNRKNIVFLLWGNEAHKKFSLIAEINDRDHLVLRTSHPSPLSAHRGFIGCNHFNKANAYLIKHKIEPIDWSIH